MKILVFENEKERFESIFQGVNIAYFEEKIEFVWLVSSQELNPLDQMTNYDAIIVDLDLSRNSQLDGYSILIKANDLGIPPNKLIIFTGSDNVEEHLNRLKLPSYGIITKPPTADAIRRHIQNAM